MSVISCPCKKHLGAPGSQEKPGKGIWGARTGGGGVDCRPTYEITGVLDLPDNLGSDTRNPYSTRTFSKMLTESCQTWLLGCASDSPRKSVTPWGIHFKSIPWLLAEGKSKFRFLTKWFQTQWSYLTQNKQVFRREGPVPHSWMYSPHGSGHMLSLRARLRGRGRGGHTGIKATLLGEALSPTDVDATSTA